MAGVKIVASEGRFGQEVGAFVRSLGLEYYAYMAVKLPKGVTCAPEDTLRSNYPDAWVRRYLERGYRFYDPVVVSGAASRVPFRWGHGGFLSRYTKAQRLVFHEAREFDITEGYCVPVTGPAGDIGLFSVAAASRAELDDVVEESVPRSSCSSFSSSTRSCEACSAAGGTASIRSRIANANACCGPAKA